MKLIKFYIATFLLLPLIGCYIAYFDIGIIEGYQVTLEIVTKYTIHTLIILSFVYFFAKSSLQSNFFQKEVSSWYAKSVLIRIRFSLLLVLGLIIYVSGIPIFLKGLDRGVVRSSLGLFGPFYNFAVKYLLLGAVALTGLLFFYVKEKKSIKRLVIINFILALLATFFTGYKSPIVTLTIPGIVFILYDKKIYKFIPYALAGFFLLVFTTMKVRGIPIDLAWVFLKNRIFNMANFGTLGVYYELNDGATINEVFFQFMSVFGKNITSLVTGIPRHSVEFVKISLSDYISYLIYPDSQRVLEGKVNLTVANFGEAIFFFGKDWFFIHSVFAGIIISKILLSLDKATVSKDIIKVILLTAYVFSIIIPWINSSGVYSLFSLPNLCYLTLLYFYLKYVLGQIVYK